MMVVMVGTVSQSLAILHKAGVFLALKDDNEDKEKKSPFLVEILKGAFLERRPLMMCRPNSVLQTPPLSPKLNSS